MKWFLIFIGACLALTVLKATALVLLILVALAVLWGTFFRPAETFVLLVLLVFTSLANQHPIAVLGVFAFLGFIALVRRDGPKMSPPPPPPAKPLPLLPASTDVGREPDS